MFSTKSLICVSYKFYLFIYIWFIIIITIIAISNSTFLFTFIYLDSQVTISDIKEDMENDSICLKKRSFEVMYKLYIRLTDLLTLNQSFTTILKGE
jgi:hypothetical protein